MNINCIFVNVQKICILALLEHSYSIIIYFHYSQNVYNGFWECVWNLHMHVEIFQEHGRNIILPIGKAPPKEETDQKKQS